MIKGFTNKLLRIAILCFPSVGLLAQISISNGVGTVGEGGVITLGGSGFGATGPSIIMWDDFDCPGVDASPCSGLTTWSSEGGGAPEFVKVGPLDSRGRAASFDFSGAFNTSEVITAGFIGAPNYNEIYVSYWRKFDYVDPGANDFTHTQFYLRGSVGQNPKIFLDILKGSFGWGIQAEGVGGGTLSKDSVQGWDLNIEQNTYHRWEWYAAVDSGAAADVLKGWLDGVIGWDVTDNLDGGSGAYKSFYFGYSNSNNTANLDATAFFDDVYIATSRARVEICNTSTWSASNKQCEIQIVAVPSDWSDSAITFTMRSGGFDNFTNKYLYVIGHGGAVNDAGYNVSGIISNSPPVANSFTLSRFDGDALNVSFAEVLTHVVDANAGDVLTVTAVAGVPGKVTAAIDMTDPANPKVNYSILDYNGGGLSFNYTVSDGALEATGTITIGFGNDNCPGIANSYQRDFNNDGVGNACDNDIDGDSIANASDACPGFSGDDSTCGLDMCFPLVSNAPNIDGDVRYSNGSLLDSGWSGAQVYNFGSDADNPDIRFQAVRSDDSHIYMSFEVYNNNQFNESDRVVLAFRPGGTSYEVQDPAPTYSMVTNEDIRLIIYPVCSGQGVAGTDCTAPTSGNYEDGYSDVKRGQPRRVTIYKNSANNWSGQQFISPSGLDMDVVVRSHLDNGNELWSVEVKLPTYAHGNWPGFSDDFLMHFNVTTASGIGSAGQFMWPAQEKAAGNLDAYSVSGPGPVYMYPLQNYEWASGHRGSSQPDCQGAPGGSAPQAPSNLTISVQ